MSLLELKNKKRRPFSDLLFTDFFDTDNFFRDGLWSKPIDEPSLNIVETDDEFEVELAAPGLSKNDFEVTIDDGYLNISTEKSESKEEKDKNYTRKEFSYNSFKRSLLLPESVEQDEVKATYKNGILKFNLAKKESAKMNTSRKVEVA